jgi:hypothetical protein
LPCSMPSVTSSALPNPPSSLPSTAT